MRAYLASIKAEIKQAPLAKQIEEENKEMRRKIKEEVTAEWIEFEKKWDEQEREYEEEMEAERLSDKEYVKTLFKTREELDMEKAERKIEKANKMAEA